MRQISDASGDVLLTQSYDPYGNPYASSGVADTGFGFAGEQLDSNGLLFLRARYYAPSMGRFLNADPSRQEMNPYQYTMGNPVNFIDPSGLISYSPHRKDSCLVPPFPDTVPPDYLSNGSHGELADLAKLGQHTGWFVYFCERWAAGSVQYLFRELGFDDAADFMDHYFEKTGTSIWIDSQRVLDEVPVFERQAMIDFTDKFRLAITNKIRRDYNQEYMAFQITTVDDPLDWYQTVGKEIYTDNFNWGMALGAFYYAFGASVVVKPQMGSNKKNVQICSTVYIFDRYNYDAAALASLMVHQHKIGWAQEYEVYGQSAPTCVSYID